MPGDILNIGDWAKPATKLIEKISDATTGLLRPWQIRRVADAEAEATVTKARGDAEAVIIRGQGAIDVTALERRAVARFVAEEGRKQENMEEIIRKALPDVAQSADPGRMENDWVANFFDKCRIVSDDDVQRLWAKVLAGEANSPGSYSKRTVNLLGSFDKRDAETFTALCGFIWQIGHAGPVPLILHVGSPYKDQGITYEALLHLASINLLTFQEMGIRHDFSLPDAAEWLLTSYYGAHVLIRPCSPYGTDAVYQLHVGHALLTAAGAELAKVCQSEPVPGFQDFILRAWAGTGQWILASPYPRVSEQKRTLGA